MLRAEIDGEVAQALALFIHGAPSTSGRIVHSEQRPESRFRPRLLVAGQHRIVSPLPRREKIELAELLVEPDRLVKHPLLLVVVTHLDKTGEREILAQR